MASFLAWSEVSGSVFKFCCEGRQGIHGTCDPNTCPGIMIMICALELIPTAHRYDPKDIVVTYSLVAGMLVMAASLVLFMV